VVIIDTTQEISKGMLEEELRESHATEMEQERKKVVL
jgi:hypothetical protein